MQRSGNGERLDWHGAFEPELSPTVFLLLVDVRVAGWLKISVRTPDADAASAQGKIHSQEPHLFYDEDYRY